MELLLAVAEDCATLRSDMSAVYGVGGESDATDIALFFGNRCYYMNAPCSWQPVTGEGHLIAQVV